MTFWDWIDQLSIWKIALICSVVSFIWTLTRHFANWTCQYIGAVIFKLTRAERDKTFREVKRKYEQQYGKRKRNE